MTVSSQPRLVSFTLDGWPVLGGKVTLDLTDRTTVLVGRNGAGKSAILEGLQAVASVASGFPRRIRPGEYDSIPKVLRILITTPTNRCLDYKYEFRPPCISDEDADIDESDGNNPEESLVSWNDCCQYADGDKEVLWTTEQGETTLFIKDEEPEILILGDTSPFGRRRKRLSSVLPEEMEWLFGVLRGIRILGKVPTRNRSRRRPSFLSVSQRGVRFGGGMAGLDLASTLSRKILLRKEREELGELESLCQRVGIGQEIVVQKFFPSEVITRSHPDNEEYLTSVLLDGTNIGLLSDGTLRVLSILIEIMNTPPSTTIIIEEPEMQIHPGMLSKLLAEIEAYTFENNLVLSTHSSQLVSWTEPKKIILVHREDGKTTVRKLGEKEISSVIDYLCEEGSLGDWIYGGLLDD